MNTPLRRADVDEWIRAASEAFGQSVGGYEKATTRAREAREAEDRARAAEHRAAIAELMSATAAVREVERRLSETLAALARPPR